ncbi:hypothetical protein Hanom_Chr16g01418301 [Helianthus anomalus]
MLWRKPSQIEDKIEYKEEIKEARKRTTTTTSTSVAFNPTGATSLLHHFNNSSASATSKAQHTFLSFLLPVFILYNTLYTDPNPNPNSPWRSK